MDETMMLYLSSQVVTLIQVGAALVAVLLIAVVILVALINTFSYR